MTSHSSGKSSTLKPFRPKSLTLLNETGNVEIYRVSEEMRKKVEEDSRRIHQLNLDNNYKSRKMTKRNEHKRLKQHNDSMEAMKQRWMAKMSNSPYNVDQMQREEHRRTTFEEKEFQKETEQWRSKLVLSMSGKASLGILNKERINTLDNQQRLALALRQTTKDQKQINAENQILNYMVLEEINAIKKRLPNMDVPDDLFEGDLEEDSRHLKSSDHLLVRKFANKTRQSRSSSPSSSYLSSSKNGPTSRSQSPSNSVVLSTSRQKSVNQQFGSTHPIDSERSIETTSSSGLYEAPRRTMQTLEEELGQMSLTDFR